MPPQMEKVYCKRCGKRLPDMNSDKYYSMDLDRRGCFCQDCYDKQMSFIGSPKNRRQIDAEELAEERRKAFLNDRKREEIEWEEEERMKIRRKLRQEYDSIDSDDDDE